MTQFEYINKMQSNEIFETLSDREDRNVSGVMKNSPNSLQFTTLNRPNTQQLAVSDTPSNKLIMQIALRCGFVFILMKQVKHSPFE